MIPDRWKNGFRALFEPLVRFLVRLKLNPNHLTTLSLVLSAVAAVYFGKGSLRLGAVFLLIGGMFDMIDGAVARASNRVTRFGALYDSTLDRYAEILIFFGIGYHFVSSLSETSVWYVVGSLAVFLGLAGSVMVSYVRARAEGLGFDCRVGLMQRPERLVLLSLGALISVHLLILALLVIAVLANFTAFQRVYHIWANENSKRWSKLPSDIGHE
ncbi:CDP-alcohol phosphatidyltransferase family protein [candidate division KSB1 bacterium]|nr:CDP-alcohol phosphatidyltransferase family protein [candidate division KSB1 bacterium]